MKKFFVVFALCCVMIFAVSCGGSGNSSKSASNGCSTYKEYECRGDASYFCGYAEDGSLKWYFHKACESGCDAATGKCGNGSDDSGTPDTDKPDTTPEQPDENDPASDSSDSEPDNGDTGTNDDDTATSTSDDNTDSANDSGDSADDADSNNSGDDNGDSTPDNDYSVPDDGDNGTNDDDTDTGTAEPTEEEKCYAAGGSWDVFADNEMEKCYKIVDCAPKPEYTEWRGEQSWVEYYDFEDDQWTHFGQNYNTEYNDSGEPKVCQYVCAENALREDNKCKPYCSAVFNGSSSKIEVETNDLLALGTSWTIEAWVKQDFNNLTTDNEVPIVRKGYAYYLTGFYKLTSQQKTYYNMAGNFVYTYNIFGGSLTAEADFTAQVQYQNNSTNLPIVTDGWNHVALSYYINSGVAHLRLYINGHLAKETTKETDYYAPNKVSTALMIGYYEDNSGQIVKKYYFNGKIDQLKISTNTYGSEFTPSKLYKDDNTIVFYDFSGNANDSSGHGLHGTATKITYSTDCK